MKEEICKLLAIADSTIYKFKREKRPIIALLEKYFTKEDLEEFLEFGTMQKFEFINLQNYSLQALEFIKLLKKLENFIVYKEENLFESKDVDYNSPYLNYNAIKKQDKRKILILPSEQEEDFINVKIAGEGIVYLALVFAKAIFKDNIDFSVDSLSQKILVLFDQFKNQEELLSYNIGLLSLGKFLDAFRQSYPMHNNYGDILFGLYQSDFISLVKLCAIHTPQDLDVAVRFCLQYNLYKYNCATDITEAYSKIITRDDLLKIKFDFEKFKEEIQKIKQSRE